MVGRHAMGTPHRAFAAVSIIAALSVCGTAHAQRITVDLDVQNAARAFSVGPVYTFDTVTIRANLRQAGTAWNATGYSGYVAYYIGDGWDSTAYVPIAGTGANGYAEFPASGSTFTSNGTWLAQVVLTNAAGDVKTWGHGRIIVLPNPSLGSASATTLRTPINWTGLEYIGTADAGPVRPGDGIGVATNADGSLTITATSATMTNGLASVAYVDGATGTLDAAISAVEDDLRMAEGAFNGLSVRDPIMTLMVDEVGPYAMITASGGGALEYWFGGALVDFGTQGVVRLTAGTTNTPALNYICAHESGVLTNFTTYPYFPTAGASRALMFEVFLMDTNSIVSGDGYAVRSWTENFANRRGLGRTSWIGERVRRLPAIWESGVQASLNATNTSVTDNFVLTTEGVGWQMHSHTIEANAVRTTMWVLNSSQGFRAITNLNDLTTLPDGVTSMFPSVGDCHAVNVFAFVESGVTPKSTRLMINLSSASYTGGAAASRLANCIADASAFDNTGVPVYMQGMTIRIARIVIRRDAGGRTYWIYDRRGQPLGTAGGGSSGSGESDPVWKAEKADYLPLAGGTMTGPLIAPVVRVTGDVYTFSGVGTGNAGIEATLRPVSNQLSSTWIGFSALRNGSGERNVAIGDSAMNASTGSYNVVIGWRAGYTAPIAETVAIGHRAGHEVQGSRNVFIGWDAANSSGAANNSIVIGAGQASLGSNTAVIGNGSITSTVLRGTVKMGTNEVAMLRADSTAGGIIASANGTTVAQFGAGGGANITFADGVTSGGLMQPAALNVTGTVAVAQALTSTASIGFVFGANAINHWTGFDAAIGSNGLFWTVGAPGAVTNVVWIAAP